MTGLTPEQAEALIHWSSFGQPGSPVTSRFVPSAPLPAFVTPASAAWSDVFDTSQTVRLLNGFEAEVMEDKWNVYSDDVTAAGSTSVHFHRSWTGAQVVQVDLMLTETGSRLIRGTWETDPATVKNGTEHFARETFAEVCRWVLGMSLAE